MIGTKGFWIDDNEYCKVVRVVDEGAGLYEFTSLDADPTVCDDSDCGGENWIGFIEDFFPED